MRVAGVEFIQGRHPGGLLVPTAVVLHRTYGRWAGDFAVGKNGRSGQPIGFHFLVGKDGRAVQFYDTNTVCNHAKGANMWSIGVEFEGRNEDQLTYGQVDAGRRIISAVCERHNIPLTYVTTGGRRRIKGCLPHALVPESNHTDVVTTDDWSRMFPATTPPPYIAPQEDDDMPGYLISDGSTIHLTDGLTKRPVPFNGNRFNELLFLGQARNRQRPDGGPDIPTMPDYLASIPNA